MTQDDATKDDDMIEMAKQLLLLTDLVDRYPQVVSRRVAGLVYIIVAGGISFATLLLMSLQSILEVGNSLFLNIGFVLLSLLFSWIVAFRLIVPLTQSYPQEPTTDQGGKGVLVVWAILAVLIITSAVITFQGGMEYLFAPILQFIMGCGFLTNFVLGKRDSDVAFYSREHFYFALAVFLSLIPMLLLPTIAYIFIIVVDMGGIFVIGIHMLITSERLLLESKRQG